MIYSPLIPKYDVHKNRKSKRAYLKELNKIEPEVTKIEDLFINQLFDESNSFTYQQLFNHYSNEWDKFVKYLASKKLKHVVPNTVYFKLKYKPEENN